MRTVHPPSPRRSRSGRALAACLALTLGLARVAAASEPAPYDLGLEAEHETLASPSFEPEPGEEHEDDGWDRAFIANGIAIGGGVGFIAWAVGAWWSEGGGGFGIDSESFFGQDTYAGGADKLGHMWGAYMTARAVSSLYQWAGYARGTAVTIGAGYSFGLLLVAELADGFTDFRFSWEDLLFNAAGAGLGALLELNDPLSELIDYRIEYAPSQAFLDEGGGLNFAEDYSGMKFLLVLRFAGIPWVRDTPLRFLAADVGYYTLHYRPDEPDEIPERHFIAGFSVDLAQVVDDLLYPWVDGFDTPKKMLYTVLRYYQVPYTRVSAIDEHIR